MSSSSINHLWKVLANLSGTDALLLGFLLLCAVGGAAVAIYIGIRGVVDVRRERHVGRAHHGPRAANR